MFRIAITGPESSGKTSLTKGLAHHYKGFWCSEYAREYLSEINRKYTLEDIEIIAKQQIRLREEIRRTPPATDFIFYDTDLIVIKIWCKVVFGICPEWIEAKISSSDFNHYLLCKPDIPWSEDPLRENPENRDDLFEIYLKELNHYKFPYTIISGLGKERLNQAISKLDQLVK